MLGTGTNTLHSVAKDEVVTQFSNQLLNPNQAELLSIWDVPMYLRREVEDGKY